MNEAPDTAPATDTTIASDTITDTDAAAPREPRWPRWRARLLRHALAALSGCLVFLSFPNYDLFPLQWVSLVPLLFALEGLRPRHAAWYGLVAGTVTNAGGFYWIDYLLGEFGHLPGVVTIPLTILLAAYQGVIFLLWARFTVALRDRTRFGLFLIAPAVFVVFDWIVPFIFPWYLANGQYRFYAVTQIVEITGVLGLTGLIVLVNVAVFTLVQALVRRAAIPWRPIGVSFGLLAAVVLFGVVRIGQIDARAEAAPKLRIGMVEANVGIWEKEAKYLPREERVPTLFANLLRHQMLSRDLAAEGAELLVWPESSFIPIGEVLTKTTPWFALALGTGDAVWAQRGDDWLPLGAEGAPPALPEAVRHRPLGAAWAAREDKALLVGDDGLLVWFDGATWTVEDAGVTEDLYAAHGVPEVGGLTYLTAMPTRLFAAGADGVVLSRATGGEWERAPKLTDATLRALAGHRRDGVYALGDGGAALAFDGENWRRLPEAPGPVLAADVAPGGALWAVGPGGLAARFGPKGWARVETGTTRDLRAVLALSDDLVLTAGDGGTLLQYDRGTWVPIATGLTDDLRGLVVHPNGGVLAVGAHGLVLRVEGGEGTTVRLKTAAGAPADLRAVAALDYAPHFPIPHEVTYIRPAVTPLPPVPEGATGDPARAAERLDHGAPMAERNTVQRGFRLPVLFGAITDRLEGPPDERERRLYNTALLIGPDGGVLGWYDKVYLLMFGEYIPLEGWFDRDTRDMLHRWIPEAGSFEAGIEPKVFPFRGFRLGVMVCYEDIIPRFTQKLAALDPHVFINVTNDAWFGKTSEPYLHLALAVFRSIEHRRVLVRSTNTGVSAFVDPVGRIVQETSLEDAETLIMDVPMLSGDTVYATLGDVVAYASLLWILALRFLPWARRREGDDGPPHRDRPARRRPKRRGAKSR